MKAQPRRDLVAADRMRIAGMAVVVPAHQVDMDVVVVKRVGSRCQHGGELLAGGRLHVVQEGLLLRRAVPAVLHIELAAIGQRESRDIERIAEGMLRDGGIGIAIHAAAGVGGNLLDLHHRHAEPFHRCRLHGLGDPLIEHRDQRAGERRRPG